MSLQAMKCQLAMLRALLHSANGTATICDATPKRNEVFTDGGKWRGPAMNELAAAGIMCRAGASNSNRPSRKSGLVRLWELSDPSGAKQTANQLQRRIKKSSAATELKQLTLLPGEDNDGKAN